MANPPTAKAFDQALGPQDEVEFYVFLSQGLPTASPAPLLLMGEGVASYSLALSAEAIALGLEIVEDGARAPVLDGNCLTIWLRVADANQHNTALAGAGVTVEVEVSIVTTADPARAKTRTFLVRIAFQ